MSRLALDINIVQKLTARWLKMLKIVCFDLEQIVADASELKSAHYEYVSRN